MDNREKNPEDLFERLKGGSVFSFLKAAPDSTGGVPLAKPQPLTCPDPSRRHQDVPGLENRLAEAEAKIRRLETDAAKPSPPLLQSNVPELFCSIQKRLGELESRLAAAPEKAASAQDLEEKLKRLLENAEGGIRTLLEEYRRSVEEKTAKIAGLAEKLGQAAEHDRQANEAGAAELGRRLKALEVELGAALEQLAAALKRALKEGENTLTSLLAKERGRHEAAEAEAAGRLDMLEKETAGIKAVIDKYQLDLSVVKQNVCGTADRAYKEAHERLEALAVKLQGDIMTAASDKFSALRLKWEAAAVEIHNAQKTAYCALEKCEKLDKSLSFLDIKTGALERKYSRHDTAPTKPGGSDE